MVKKAIDSRIPALIRNGVQEKKRSFFVVVGDRQKDVIVNLYHILLNVDLKLNKSVLWAYKNKLLGFTSHRQKREKKIRKEIKRGIREADTEDPFELFVSTQNIRYVYYKETEKILGNTYGMCILQDFEAITPNLLARTIETVEGGGLVLLLLKGMNSLKQLYTMSMDVHSRYRTEAHDDVVARFNERFILSLGRCDSCLVVDDELNVLPISGGRSVQQLPPPDPEALGKTPAQRELAEIKESLADTQPVGPLISLAKTVDQAKALLTFVDAIAEKTLQSTVTLTAARGRGKSAALGVAIAAAVAHGYSNIFITSPSPENLKTLFEFIFKGFDALDYADHADYTIIQSTNPDFNKAIVRVNIHRNHRQTIQYIQPQDAYTLGQAELLVIDEAAAIPLPLVRKLMGPYLVFMASTINGYEGTGRSLSLKLIQQLREQSRGGSKTNNGDQVTDRSSGKPSKHEGTVSTGGRSLREIKLSEPIRYAEGDAVESWLNKLLCLDATLPTKSNINGCPHPSECELLYVNRDTLFSFHHVSEKFLQQMMALYVASHYKNSPNDLQLMSDAPAHQLFVLVPPVSENQNRLPEPLCVVQLALEGQISRESVLNSLARGQRAGGDLIPWLISQQFQDENFAALSGARIVRIATNPEYTNMGYGSRALELLTDFFSHKFLPLTEDGPANLPVAGGEADAMPRVTDAELEATTLLKDDVRVRDIAAMPPLFSRLTERRPAKLDYLGVSYGLTQPLHKFWKRAHYAPVYLRQTANELTGEHTCVMLKALGGVDGDTDTDPAWLGAYAADFHRRFLALLSFQFRGFGAVQALSIEESAKAGMRLSGREGKGSSSTATGAGLSKAELDELFSPYDLKRLESYANNMLDYHVILDLLPRIAELFFLERLQGTDPVALSGVQKALVCAIGLQRKGLEDVEKELGVASSQLLSMFVKVVRKVSQYFRAVAEREAGKDMPGRIGAATGEAHVDGANKEEEEGENSMAPLAQTLEEDLEEGADEFEREERERKREMVSALATERFAIDNLDDEAWRDAEKQIKSSSSGGNANGATPGRIATVSVPKKAGAGTEEEKSLGKKAKDGSSEKKRKVSAMEDARRELEKIENSTGGKKRSKKQK